MKKFVFYIFVTFLIQVIPSISFSQNIENNVKVVVMFGDSITMGGKWDKLFVPELIANEGLKSDMTSGFLQRMNDVYRHQPEIVFIMGGINDIAGGISPEHIFSNIKRIVNKLRRRGIIPVIQATLYSRKDYFNGPVEKLNNLLEEYTSSNNIDFIDLNPHLCNNKRLKKKYTFDGLHIKPVAYYIWKKEIEKVLRKYNVTPYQLAKTVSSDNQRKY